MMRSMLLASLALSPVLIHAQATVPAQTSKAAPVLQAGLVEPKAFSSAADGGTATTALRVSTGVIGPKLISTVDVAAGDDWTAAEKSRTAVVEMMVDEAGNPTDLKIVRSCGSEMDKNLLTAVKQYRFRPGTVSHQVTAMPVDLEVTILRPSF
ncbi:energy transducer TonB family protein [Granulicella arctica]|uniref:TonB family protein n=1 Tax=Granulicella arctica TaxID=940613 RepID=A0A7Y9PDH9_9BACT|nr:energy transducer TonB [Granulicella arctica]NYF77869.1 TonB family protein [Granulicella arctica]